MSFHVVSLTRTSKPVQPSVPPNSHGKANCLIVKGYAGFLTISKCGYASATATTHRDVYVFKGKGFPRKCWRELKIPPPVTFIFPAECALWIPKVSSTEIGNNGWKLIFVENDTSDTWEYISGARENGERVEQWKIFSVGIQYITPLGEEGLCRGWRHFASIRRHLMTHSGGIQSPSLPEYLARETGEAPEGINLRMPRAKRRGYIYIPIREF